MKTLIKSMATAAICLGLLSGCAAKSASSTDLIERTAPITMNSVAFTDYNLKRTYTRGFAQPHGLRLPDRSPHPVLRSGRRTHRCETDLAALDHPGQQHRYLS